MYKNFDTAVPSQPLIVPANLQQLLSDSNFLKTSLQTSAVIQLTALNDVETSAMIVSRMGNTPISQRKEASKQDDHRQQVILQSRLGSATSTDRIEVQSATLPPVTSINQAMEQGEDSNRVEVQSTPPVTSINQAMEGAWWWGSLEPISPASRSPTNEEETAVGEPQHYSLLEPVTHHDFTHHEIDPAYIVGQSNHPTRGQLEYTRARAEAETGSTHGPKINVGPLPVTPSQNPANRKNSKEMGLCYNCGEMGHLKRNCTNAESCFECRNTDHVFADCPKIKRTVKISDMNALCPENICTLSSVSKVADSDSIAKRMKFSTTLEDTTTELTEHLERQRQVKMLREKLELDAEIEVLEAKTVKVDTGANSPTGTTMLLSDFPKETLRFIKKEVSVADAAVVETPFPKQAVLVLLVSDLSHYLNGMAFDNEDTTGSLKKFASEHGLWIYGPSAGVDSHDQIVYSKQQTHNVVQWSGKMCDFIQMCLQAQDKYATVGLQRRDSEGIFNLTLLQAKRICGEIIKTVVDAPSKDDTTKLQELLNTYQKSSKNDQWYVNTTQGLSLNKLYIILYHSYYRPKKFASYTCPPSIPPITPSIILSRRQRLKLNGPPQSRKSSCTSIRSRVNPTTTSELVKDTTPVNKIWFELLSTTPPSEVPRGQTDNTMEIIIKNSTQIGPSREAADDSSSNQHKGRPCLVRKTIGLQAYQKFSPQRKDSPPRVQVTKFEQKPPNRSFDMKRLGPKRTEVESEKFKLDSTSTSISPPWVVTATGTHAGGPNMKVVDQRTSASPIAMGTSSLGLAPRRRGCRGGTGPNTPQLSVSPLTLKRKRDVNRSGGPLVSANHTQRIRRPPTLPPVDQSPTRGCYDQGLVNATAAYGYGAFPHYPAHDLRELIPRWRLSTSSRAELEAFISCMPAQPTTRNYSGAIVDPKPVIVTNPCPQIIVSRNLYY